MIEAMIALLTYGVGTGGVAGNFLFQLEQLGFFSYILPFLMIFAIVFAILDKVGFLGKNKAINVVIALAVGLMSLQFNFVSYFFAEIFPRMGVLLSIILTAIILLSLFLDFKKKGTKFAIGLIAFVGFIIIVVQSLDVFNWGYSLGGGSWAWWLEENLAAIITIALVAGGIIAIVKKPSDGKGKEKYLKIADKYSSDEE